MRKHIKQLLSLALALLLILSLAACSSPGPGLGAWPSDNAAAPPDDSGGAVVDLRPGNTGGLDDRASAAQTFGGTVLLSVQSESEQVEAGDVLDLTPGDTIMSLSEFLTASIQARQVFQNRLGQALAGAGLQASAGDEAIRMEPVNTADVFATLIAWENGPEAALDFWQNSVDGEGVWTLEAEEEDNTVYLLMYKDDVPTVEFFARWYEADQYFYGIFNTVNYSLEMDVVRTEHGFACQLYEPGTPAIYRLAFSGDGTGDGGVGCTFAIAEQPDVLSGLETPAYARDWPELGDPARADYILIEGTTLTVSRSGAENRYTIDANAASATPEPLSIPGASQPAQSAAASDYARLWHGSPVLGSGWSERFALYADGSFIWGANDMDGATRLRYLAGTWDVENGQLILNARLAIGWEGGEVVQNTGTGSYASGEVILNPATTVYQVDDTLILPVSGITRDSERGLDTVVFNELQCWDYSGQAAAAMTGFWQSFMSTWNRAPIPKDRTQPVSGLS